MSEKKKWAELLNFKSIKTKLVIIMILIAAIPILILGIASILEFTINSNLDFEKNGISLGDSVEEHVNSKFKAVENMVDYIVEKNKFDDSEEDKLSLEKDFELFKEGNPDILFCYYYSEDKKEFVMYPNDSMPEDDYTKRDWYIKAKDAKGEYTFTDVYKDIMTNEYVATISKAIMENGNLKGVICIDFKLSSIADSIANVKYGETGILSLVDQKGTVIANTNKELIGNTDIGEEQAWSTILNNESGLVEINIDGENYKVNFVTSKTTGWKILLEISQKELDKSVNKYKKVLIMTAIILLIFAIISGEVFSRKLAKSINKIKKGIEKAASGDFSNSIDISTGDELEELADEFNEMQENISNLIRKVDNSIVELNNTSSNVKEMSEQVATSIGEVASTIGEISKGSMESAENLVTLSNNLEGVSGEINKINNATQNINEAAETSNNLGKDGIDIIQILMEKSNNTKKSTLEVSDVVSKVEESVKSIAVMNQTISQITEQTNLLALNAAIEAARAGEAGKGFAVVADEIRKLAEQTALSAKEIDDVIAEISKNVNLAVKQVEETNSTVESQEAAVTSGENIFNNIIRSIEDLTKKVEEVTQSVDEVTKNKNSVVEEVQNLSAIAEETAAGSEEVSASTEEISSSTDEFVENAKLLREISQELESEIRQFKLK